LHGILDKLNLFDGRLIKEYEIRKEEKGMRKAFFFLLFPGLFTVPL
jgi:hypothetical protein